MDRKFRIVDYPEQEYLEIYEDGILIKGLYSSDYFLTRQAVAEVLNYFGNSVEIEEVEFID